MHACTPMYILYTQYMCIYTIYIYEYYLKVVKKGNFLFGGGGEAIIKRLKIVDYQMILTHAQRFLYCTLYFVYFQNTFNPHEMRSK